MSFICNLGHRDRPGVEDRQRLGIDHRQRAGKEQGHIEPWGGLVPRFVLCAQGDLKREG